MVSLTLHVLLYIMYTHGLDNLALHRPTWEQYPWPDNNRDYGSENAVDGMYTDRGYEGQCTISADGKYNATWGVDLGSVASISHIDIYYRTDNLQNGVYIERMAGFFVYVSNTTSKDDGYLCHHYESTEQRMLSEDQQINCSLQGRYVIYYNERRSGCNGTYGDDCIYPCPQNCLDRKCDTNTGHCLRCVPGYQGTICNQVCNNNTYGPACALICGNCCNGETCHHINGTCLHGCAEGALGDTCQEGCQSGYYGRNCSHRCRENCIVTSQCDRITGRCDVRATDTQLSYNIVIVVVSVLIVITGSLINFVIWKRNVAKLNRMSQGNMPQPSSKRGTLKEF